MLASLVYVGLSKDADIRQMWEPLTASWAAQAAKVVVQTE